ncbi:DUF2341 domain-containing protein, partial [bacterium]|nr:DUF2341 domain-containing protein [bacterium]
MLKRFSGIFFLIFLFVSTLFADQGGKDNFGYMWTSSGGTPVIDYNWIDVKSGTNLFGDSFDDSVSSTIALPFNFTFYGETFDSVRISSNGWISFSAHTVLDPTPANTAIPAGVGPDSLIAVYWDDLNSVSGRGGGVFWDSTGSAPNRKFVVQWDIRDTVTSAVRVRHFEAILFENSNLIKFQYNEIDAIYNGGETATIGLKQNTSDGIQYSFDTASSVLSGFAMLFHNKYTGTADAAISPLSVQAGSVQTFSYMFDNITAAPAGLGKLDRFAVGNPFGASFTPTLTSIKINNDNAFVQMSSNKPIDAGFATWQYSGDSLIVQTSNFDVIDSLKITFIQVIPTSLSEDNSYTGSYDAELDSSSKKLATGGVNWDVDIVANTVSYYVLSLSTNNPVAGDTIDVTVTAYDENNNVAETNDTTLVEFLSSSSNVQLLPGSDTLTAGVVNFQAIAIVVEDFTLIARSQSDTLKTGIGELISVSAAPANGLENVSGNSGSLSNGKETFLYFDDFENRATDTQPKTWELPDINMVIQDDAGLKVLDDATGTGANAAALHAFGSDIAVRQRFRSITGTIDHAGVVGRFLNDNNEVYGGIVTSTTAEIWNRINGSFSQIGSTWTISDVGTNWHVQELRIEDNSVDLYIDDALVGGGTLDAGAPTSGRSGFWTQYSQQGYRDWHIFRKYADPDPTSVLGGEIAGNYYLLNWNSWSYKRAITVTNSTGGALSDYQTLVTLNTADLGNPYSNINSDGSDIRFSTGDNAAPLPYWIENWDNTGESKVWVKIPSIATGSPSPINLYYGNPDAGKVIAG